MASAIDPTLDGDLTTTAKAVRKSELQTALNTAKTEITALQGSGDADEKVKVSSDDTTAGYLLGKALGGTAISTVEGSGGGDETLTFNLDNTAVTPGSYTLSSITVDQQGRLTAASSGSVSGFVSETSGTGSAELPSGTTAQRDGSPSAGYIRFNSTTTGFEGYDGSSWGEIGGGGGATGGGTDKVFYENGQTVTTDYTITANSNAMSAGPITIDAGVTVTVGSGQTWVVV